MYEKFTDRARKVMQLTADEAMRFNHEYIGTEHLLLALISEGSGVAANVLKNLEVNMHKVRFEVERIVQAGPDMVMTGRRPQTPRAKKALEFAIEEARALGHDLVGTEHLLLGVLREGEGLAAQVLMNMGVRLETVREEVLNLLGHSGSLARPPASDWQDEDASEPEGATRPELQHLPASARAIVAEFDCQIDVIKEEKEQAVGAQSWERAAEHRDLEYKLRKLRDEFLSHWPR
ncbi:MAG: hypothetical protein HY289_06275 [Planctomycetes bacterium]|nr:hypothetical protein [Planctomycetota bacterium]